MQHHPLDLDVSAAMSRYSVLRASIRGTDSDIMLAPLQTLLLSPLQPSGVNILDILLVYIEQVRCPWFSAPL